MIVARDVAELHVVLSRLSTRGGAQRLITLLRLAELKPSSPLPLRATSVQSRRAALNAPRGAADPTSMEIQANAAMMIQANSLEAIRTTLSAAQAAPATQEAQAAVILELSTAAQQLLHALALAAPSTGVHSARARRGLAPSCISRPGASLYRIMSAFELRTQLLELHAERALAEETGVAGIASYMDDLQRDIDALDAAYVGAAVTEIAVVPGAALRPELRLAP